MPAVGYHRELLENFLKRFCKFYDRLLNYREQPALQADVQLETEFEEFFAALLMQKRPEPPLHNNRPS